MQGANIRLSDVASIRYSRNESIAGIFFSNPGDPLPSFKFLRPLGSAPRFFNIPTPFTICSSSKGILLIRDNPTGTYHVCNPFVHATASYWCLPDLPRVHILGTPVVLAMDFRDPVSPSFHLICAIQERDGYYTFDTFSSTKFRWSKQSGAAHLGQFGHNIIPTTGVSDGLGTAFWLTDFPHVVVKYTMPPIRDKALQFIEIPRELSRSARLQLGRLGDHGIGLVAVLPTEIRLYLYDRDASNRDDGVWWKPQGFLNVRRQNGEVTQGSDGYGFLLVCPQTQERPETVRFEKDLPLWINGRMTVLQITHESRTEISWRLHQMPFFPVPAGFNIADCVPHICTKLIPTELI